MGVKSYRPVTPTRRYYQSSDRSDLTDAGPYRPLLRSRHQKAGRNNLGRVTAPGRGGGERRHFRVVDFLRLKHDQPARVIAIEYDPNRSGRIAHICYPDGTHSYILAPDGLKAGDRVESGRNAPLRPGNALPLAQIPLGLEIHNVQLFPNARTGMVRAAGTTAQILAKEGDFAHVKLPSGEVRMVRLECYATLGRVSNIEHNSLSIGKAGRQRHRGIRPRSRAVAMNPVDHPMGGGEGKSSGGRHPCDRKGFPAKGKKTRKHKRHSSRYIVARRP